MRELLRHGPRTVFLPLPVRDDVAEALRAAGHRVTWGSVEAFEASDAVVVCEPSPSALFYAGVIRGSLARGRHVLLLQLADGDPPADPPEAWALVVGWARATAPTVAELVGLVGDWDPLSQAFDPPRSDLDRLCDVLAELDQTGRP